MEIRTLQKIDFYKLHEAFCQAFADYPFNMQVSQEAFAKRLQRMGFTYELSAGFWQDRWTAFVLHGKGIFETKKSLYNGGTGVLPHARGQKIIPKIYEYLLPKCQDYTQIILEVLTQNQSAIKLYENLGFVQKRLLLSFELKNILVSNKKLPKNATLHISQNIDEKIFDYFTDKNPSWQNSYAAINHNINYESILEIRTPDKILGLLVYEPLGSKISFLGVHPQHRRQGIATILLKNMQMICPSAHLKIFNVDSENLSLINFLKSIGFLHIFGQKEMLLSLS